MADGAKRIRRARPGDDIYTVDLPYQTISELSEQLDFDCDGCHRLFTGQEVIDLCKPFLNKGQQWGWLKCPQCGHQTQITFGMDTVQ